MHFNPMLPFKTLSQIGDVFGKVVLLRLDLNVPIENGLVRDDFRIAQSLPTISFLQKAGAKVVILAHLESVETSSLLPVFEYLKKDHNIVFAKTITEARQLLETLSTGGMVLLENLRTLSTGEKENDPVFAKELASLGEIYVNDAFSVSHRKHASVVGVPACLSHFAGIQFEKEYAKLSEAFSPAHPFVFILGGAKFETKLPLVTKFLEKADTVFIGGALSNDIFRQLGSEVGTSLLSPHPVDLTTVIASPKLLVPSDVRVNTPVASPKQLGEVLATDKILDAGPQTISDLKKVLSGAKFVLWNGPLGDYEKGFSQSTIELANAIIESGAYSVVGGGDTLAVLAQADLLDKFSFVSTAGGAMLDFLANETLPGIKALQ